MCVISISHNYDIHGETSTGQRLRRHYKTIQWFPELLLRLALLCLCSYQMGQELERGSAATGSEQRTTSLRELQDLIHLIITGGKVDSGNTIKVYLKIKIVGI
jgi:hypothetical protein